MLERGSYQIWRKGEDGWALYQEGSASLPVIPLAVTYSGKVSELISVPPLLAIANLNILHAQRQADLQHALHVAALPVMYLKGYEDTDNEIALSANSAILLPKLAMWVMPSRLPLHLKASRTSSVSWRTKCAIWVSPQSSVRPIQLKQPKLKAMDRSDSDSMLSVVSGLGERTAERNGNGRGLCGP